jgi:hypothetical protein
MFPCRCGPEANHSDLTRHKGYFNGRALTEGTRLVPTIIWFFGSLHMTVSCFAMRRQQAITRPSAQYPQSGVRQMPF